ncbi:unnamed protein product [Bursaphelenchus xylophilus]|uniref:Serine/threonine-protein kinase receptor n=1 Tax=Bursaphelenchus xylophilus TaxID=6326 RepID=A0A1I7RZF3_BURXY|nr:unnamed protein product [Bursaphelenchus xylophilus]CAG9106485.1 unnamed protein product [Bursaphelenchus xylophilus]
MTRPSSLRRLAMIWLLLFLSLPFIICFEEEDDDSNIKAFLNMNGTIRRVPHYVEVHGIEGVNYNLDEHGMPYIYCDALNTTCKGSEADCTKPKKCYQERRSHRLGCMAVFVYNTTEMSSSANKTIPQESAMLKGCWSQDESELRECEEHDECVASTRKTGAQGRAAKFCCCRTHNCNQNLTFYSDVLPKTRIHNDPKLMFFDNVHWLSRLLLSTDFFAVSAILLLIILFLFGLCFAVWIYRKQKRRKTTIKLEPYAPEDIHSEGTVEITTEGTALLGHKANDLRQSTLQNMTSTVLISSGHFSELYRAEVADASVVLKVYHNGDSDCWLNEQEVYSIKAVRKHENMATFLASFKHNAQYWFVIRYYPLGSIFDFLESNVANVQEATKILSTMLNGLSFLHEEFFFEGELKPTVVHRDFKSKNVLLKADLTAVIGDFSLSIKCENGRMSTDENQSQVGTRRYMSPEVLEGATEFTGFAFQQIDVYAAALVIWEVASRTVVPEHPDEPLPVYFLPYELEIGKTPTLGTMRDLVVMKKCRPQSRCTLYENPITSRILKTMQDMWDNEPDGRITSSCARDRMVHLHDVALGRCPIDGHMIEAGPTPCGSVHSLDGTTRTESSLGVPSGTGTTIPLEQLIRMADTPSTSTSSVTGYNPVYNP